MATDNTLHISCTDNTIELKSATLSNEYSGNVYHSFAKGSFRIVDNAGTIKFLFPANNNLAIWSGKINDLVVDGNTIDAASFKTYQQNNFYTIEDSSNRIEISSSTTDQQFTLPAGSWLMGISVFPDGGDDGEIQVGTTLGGDDILPDNTYPQGVDSTNTVIKHFIEPTIVYIKNITGKQISFYIIKA